LCTRDGRWRAGERDHQVGAISLGSRGNLPAAGSTRTGSPQRVVDQPQRLSVVAGDRLSGTDCTTSFSTARAAHRHLGRRVVFNRNCGTAASSCGLDGLSRLVQFD
jgi:hypothetical protein